VHAPVLPDRSPSGAVWLRRRLDEQWQRVEQLVTLADLEVHVWPR
jgi:hypothetical protein